MYGCGEIGGVLGVDTLSVGGEEYAVSEIFPLPGFQFFWKKFCVCLSEVELKHAHVRFD
jgi:hypothetical protein